MRRTLAASILAGAIVGSSLFVLVSVLAPIGFHSRSWTGEEDWAACARISKVSPDEAVRTSLASHGLREEDMSSVRVMPLYLNGTGGAFRVMCRDGLRILESVGGTGMSVDGQNHFVWRVLSAQGEITMCVYHDFIDWDTGAIVLAQRPC